jgi:anti-sigma factor RsiW
MRECVAEDVLQAYFDGELSPELMERVATHLAACEVCGAAAREIETESLVIAEAFAPELAMSVPTGRLRLRLDAAIVELESEQRRVAQEARGSRLNSWLAVLMSPFSFAPSSALGFASLIAVLATGALFAFVALRPKPQALQAARASQTPGLVRDVDINRNPGGQAVAAPAPAENVTNVAVAGGRGVESAKNRNSRPHRAGRENGPVYDVDPTMTESVAAVRLLPGEKNYLKVIASLDTAIKAGGDNALRPTLRAEYERNLQVVDEAIAQTRVVAQRNPNDKDAADFLLSAYQSKVDLMNTVAEQAQLSTMYR